MTTTSTPRIKTLYDETVRKEVMEKFSLTNPHDAPSIAKIMINCGIGRFLENQKLKPEIRDTVFSTLSVITGQKPVMIKARRSVSNFKVRAGAPSAVSGSFFVHHAFPAFLPFLHRGSSTCMEPLGNHWLGIG